MTYYYPDARLLLFAKAPVLGQVKTRLAKEVGAQQALSVHEALLKHTAKMLKRQDLCSVNLWIDRESELAFFKKLNISDSLYYQQGCDLGERMAHAATKTLARHSMVVIIGSDSPAMDANYLLQALSCLARNDSDVVLGPAEDGGYVLIGLRKYNRRVFSNIHWGTDKVLQQTMGQLKQCGFSYTLLDALWDVDRLDDLQRFQQLLAEQ